MRKLITPDGTRDLLYGECAERRLIETNLTALFKDAGFHEVITPFLEFYDLFNTKERAFSSENMYKLTDSKGRLMVIRPDSTLPIIRLAQTRLKDEPRPLKLCYNQTIYRANPKEAGRDDEIAQNGVEIIGGNSDESDLEALTLALKALDILNLDYRFEIGDCGIFNALINAENMGEEEAETLRKLIDAKNYPELKKVSSASFAALSRLFGGANVFEEAIKIFNSVLSKNSDLKSELERLKSVYLKLSDKGKNAKVFVDLGLTNTRGYYAGIRFNGYADGFGKPILSGGRYKFGETDGVGFALNVTAIAEILSDC